MINDKVVISFTNVDKSYAKFLYNLYNEAIVIVML